MGKRIASDDSKLFDRRSVLQKFGTVGLSGVAITESTETGSAHHVEDLKIEPSQATVTAGKATTFTVHWVSGHGSDACFVFAVETENGWQEIDAASQSALDTGQHVHLEKELTIPEDIGAGEYKLRVSASEAYHRCPYPGEKGFPILASDAKVTVEEGDSVANRIETKDGLIDTIRAEAGAIVTEEGAETLDMNAEELLGEIKQAKSQGDLPTQYDRALDRMITAEKVTEAATKVGKDPARVTAESLTELLVMLAFARIAKGALRGAGRVGSVFVAKLDDLASQARRGIKRLSGKPVLPPGVRRQLDEIVAGVNRRIDDFLDDYSDNFRETGEKIVSGSRSINDVFDVLSSSVVQAFNSIKEWVVQTLTVLFYTFYMKDIDTQIESKMDDLEIAIEQETLKEGGKADHTETQRDCVTELQNKRDAFINVMDTSDRLEEGLSLLIVAVAAGAVLLYGISALLSASGIGLTAAAVLASVASTLVTVATYLTVALVGLLAAGLVLGVGFLFYATEKHGETVSHIVNYESNGGAVQ